MRWSNWSAVRKTFQRRLSIEQLEPRRLMAVSTSLSNGTLTITGDAGADDIAIVGTANPGEITVIGRNGTLVDGVVNGSTTISGVTAHLEADFGDGDNVVNLDNVYLAGHLEIETGHGNDRLILGASGVVSSALYCRVSDGGGSDMIRADGRNLYVGDDLRVDVGGRMDHYNSVTLIGASGRAGVSVAGGSGGFNEFIVRDVTAGGSLPPTSSEMFAGLSLNLSVHGGAPINNIAIYNSATSGVLMAGGPSGQNSIYMDTCYAARFIQVMSFTSAPGYIPEPAVPAPYNIDATVTVARCQTPQIVVQTWSGAYLGGNDTVFIYGNHIMGPPIQVTLPTSTPAHVVYVETGDGNDLMIASANVAKGDWIMSFSPGDDALYLAGNVVTGFASADGGTGTNRLNLFGNQFGGFAALRFQ